MNGTEPATNVEAADSKPSVVVAASSATTTKPKTTIPMQRAVTEIRVAVGSTNPSKLHAVQMAFERVLAPRLSSSAASTSSALDDRSRLNEGDDNHINYHPNLHLDIQGFHVQSQVSVQPKGDEETKTGAQNRARAAYQAYKEQFNKVPHFAIGLEGGVEITTKATIHSDDVSGSKSGDEGQEADDVWCMAWMAIYGKRQALLADLVAASTCHHYYGDKRPIFGLAKTSSFLLPTSISTLLIKEGWELGDADDKVFGRKQSKHGAGTVGILTDFLIPRAAYYEHALIMALIPWIRPDLYPHGSSR